VCKARKPDCPSCIIRDLCDYRQKTGGKSPAPPLLPETAARPRKRRAAAD